jgi:hypothetical protein
MFKYRMVLLLLLLLASLVVVKNVETCSPALGWLPAGDWLIAIYCCTYLLASSFVFNVNLIIKDKYHNIYFGCLLPIIILMLINY